MRSSGDLPLYGDTQPLLADPLTLPESREHSRHRARPVAPSTGDPRGHPTTSKSFETDDD